MTRRAIDTAAIRQVVVPGVCLVLLTSMSDGSHLPLNGDLLRKGNKKYRAQQCEIKDGLYSFLGLRLSSYQFCKKRFSCRSVKA